MSDRIAEIEARLEGLAMIAETPSISDAAAESILYEWRKHAPADIRYLLDELDEVNAEYERDKRDFDEAHNEIKCPECGCGVISDCEAAECGCDAPVCARDGGSTLAEHYVGMVAEVERLRKLCAELVGPEMKEDI